jgi:cephalosporin hydroxylase
VDPIRKFREEVQSNIDGLREDFTLKSRSLSWLRDTLPHRYSYNFSWMGVPIIQYPQDIVAMQELIWRVKPEMIIETGVAHGGSLVYYASLLELTGRGEVLGIDIDIRSHNRAMIEAHPMARRISMIQGSSVDAAVVREVRVRAAGRAPVMVVLDSNHTHEHVLGELRAYADLVTVGSYCVVFDTVVEDLPGDLYPDRPWSAGNSPKTAVHAFLREDDRFEIDRDVEAKILITVAPDGYLRRVR